MLDNICILVLGPINAGFSLKFDDLTAFPTAMWKLLLNQALLTKMLSTVVQLREAKIVRCACTGDTCVSQTRQKKWRRKMRKKTVAKRMTKKTRYTQIRPTD